MTPGYDTLSVLRVSKLMKALADQRTLPQEYKFTPRTPTVDADEGEIMARWIDRDQIADLITDDAKATVYTSGKFSLETTEVPNIKLGRAFTQGQINSMRRVAAGAALAEDKDGVKQAMLGIGDKLLRGIRDRVEHLLTCMRLDSFSYNRGGLVIPNLTWGMPQILNVVAGTPWYGNAATATPVDNLLSIELIMRTVFGVQLDRATMTTSAFRAGIATAEFQNKAKVLLRSDIGYTNLSLLNLKQQQSFFETVTGLKIDLNDGSYWSQDTTGLQSRAQFQPDSKVILEFSGFDNDPAVWDFANGVVTESILSSWLPNSGVNGGGIPGMIGSFDGGKRGPVGYATVPSDLNPPNVTMWAVQRGFPRKHKLQANAVLDIGPVTNPIPITDQF